MSGNDKAGTGPAVNADTGQVTAPGDPLPEVEAPTPPAVEDDGVLALGDTWTFPAKGKGWQQVLRPGGSAVNVMAKRGRCRFVPEAPGVYVANGHSITAQ